ncbi:MAG: NAD(P)H:quinone oxidoreductase [Sedimentisphaerales bacterium]
MKILVLYYSMYGHTLKMAQAAKEGVLSVDGIEVILRRVAEFTENEQKILNDKYAKQVWEKQRDIPVCQLDELKQADGFIIGTPTRYGNMAAQMKRFFDSTVQLWLEGALEGKPVGLFTSTATTHGGQETTLLSMMPPLLHLGMIIVGVPYSTPGMLHTEGRGGTPYGASTVAGPQNDLQPTPEDLEITKALGKRVAETALKLRV